MEIERKRFVVDVPFTKADSPTGELELKGYASTWSRDRDDEYVDPTAFGGLKGYLASNPILLWQHDKDKPIGTVRAAIADEHGLHVKALIPKPDDREPDWAHLAYQKTRRGIVRTFSIGGVFHKQFERGRKVIKSIDLMEVSVVSVPSNPDSIFEVAAKAVNDVFDRPELSQKAISQMEQIIGMKGVFDPDLASMSDAELIERYHELADFYRKAGRIPPELETWQQVSDAIKEGETLEERMRHSSDAILLVQQTKGLVKENGRLQEDLILSASEHLRKAADAFDQLLVLDGELETDDQDD